MASTDLNLEQPGSLPRPGTIGRLVRLGFGVACIYYVISLWDVRGDLLFDQSSIRPLIWNGILPTLFLVSYVVNIGFSRAWRKRPAIVTAASMLIAAGVGFSQSETLQSPFLANTVWAFELYLFTHLGVSFLLAAVLATPGCEMRSIHHLYANVTGRPAVEHRCPVGPLSAIDRWETRLKQPK